MIIRGGTIHDGTGKVFVGDIQIQNETITSIKEKIDSADETIVDATGKDIFPGFIQAVSSWGISGSMYEIRPSSSDNEELSSPITPELEVKYAFNGRSITIQQLGAFGLTTVGVCPADTNVFGGIGAAFDVDGFDPFSMCLNPATGMKASVCSDIKRSYGTRQVAPMTKMSVFEQFTDQLKKAADYKPDPAKETDVKLAALKRVIDHELPLFVSCENAQDVRNVQEIIRPYGIELIIINGYGLHAEDTWIIDGHTSLIVRCAAGYYDHYAMALDLEGIASLAEKGLPVAVSGVSGSLNIREDVLWLGIDMMKVLHDESKVLPMMTSTPAKLLGIDKLTGTLEEGKRADLVIFEGNPLKTWKAPIEATYMKGRVIYKKGDEMKCM